MSFLDSIPIVGSLLGGLFGSSSGAQSANNSGSAAMNADQQARDQARNRLGLMQFGPQDWNDFLTASGPDSPIKSKQNAKLAAQNSFFSKYPSYQSSLGTANNQYLAQMANLLQQEKGNTAHLDTLARGAEGIGQDLATRSKAQTALMSKQRLGSLNQKAAAQLGWQGPGSLLSNQMTANQRLVGQDQDAANLQADTQGAQMMQGARQSRIGMLGNRYNTTGGLQQGLIGQTRDLGLQPAQARNSLFGDNSFTQIPNYNPSMFNPNSQFGNAMGSLAPALGQMGSSGQFSQLLGGLFM